MNPDSSTSSEQELRMVKYAHSHHNQQQAERALEVTFVSEDGVEIRVPVKSLVNVSSVFAGMVRVPQQNPIDVNRENIEALEADTYIQFDASGKVLQMFVNVILSPQPKMPVATLPEVLDLLRLCSIFNLHISTISAIRDLAKKQGTKEPWNLVVLAAFHNDPILFQHALDNLTFSEFLRGSKGHPTDFWTRIGQLKDPWKIKVLQHVLGDPNRWIYTPSGYWVGSEAENQYRYWQSMMDTRLSGIFSEEKIPKSLSVLGLWFFRALCVAMSVRITIYLFGKIPWKRMALSILNSIHARLKDLFDKIPWKKMALAVRDSIRAKVRNLFDKIPWKKMDLAVSIRAKGMDLFDKIPFKKMDLAVLDSIGPKVKDYFRKIPWKTMALYVRENIRAKVKEYFCKIPWNTMALYVRDNIRAKLQDFLEKIPWKKIAVSVRDSIRDTLMDLFDKIPGNKWLLSVSNQYLHLPASESK